MQIDKQELTEIIQTVVETTINALENKCAFGKRGASANGLVTKSAYQKTEQLLYNYNGFQRIITERMKEIEDIRKFGVPKKSKDITKFGGVSGSTGGVVTQEETVEAAVRTVQASVQGTVQAIALIDKCMRSLSHDPYYCILEKRYFEGRTQEDIALEMNCDQATISRNRSRLVRELSLRLFPDQSIEEMMN